jgi:hypothetical protein
MYEGFDAMTRLLSFMANGAIYEQLGLEVVVYIAFINGSGFTVEIDDDGAHIVKSVITCEMCDDRVFKNGTCFVCSELIKHD